MHLEPAASIIKKLGGLTAVAGAAGVSVTSVQRWRLPKRKGGSGGTVPNRHVATLMAFAVKRNVYLGFHEFFPAGPTAIGAA